MNLIARIHCILRVNMELCYVRTISSLHLGIKKKIKTDFVLNMQWTTLQTAVLLRKWGRGDKHPPTCVYSFSDDDKSYCPSYFFSGFKAQTAPDCRRKVPTDHFSFTVMQGSLNLWSCIFFSCVLTGLYNTWLQSVQPAFLRCFCTLWGKTGSSGAHSWS